MAPISEQDKVKAWFTENRYAYKWLQLRCLCTKEPDSLKLVFGRLTAEFGPVPQKSDVLLETPSLAFLSLPFAIDEFDDILQASDKEVEINGKKSHLDLSFFRGGVQNPGMTWIWNGASPFTLHAEEIAWKHLYYRDGASSNITLEQTFSGFEAKENELKSAIKPYESLESATRVLIAKNAELNNCSRPMFEIVLPRPIRIETASLDEGRLHVSALAHKDCPDKLFLGYIANFHEKPAENARVELATSKDGSPLEDFVLFEKKIYLKDCFRATLLVGDGGKKLFDQETRIDKGLVKNPRINAYRSFEGYAEKLKWFENPHREYSKNPDVVTPKTSIQFEHRITELFHFAGFMTLWLQDTPNPDIAAFCDDPTSTILIECTIKESTDDKIDKLISRVNNLKKQTDAEVLGVFVLLEGDPNASVIKKIASERMALLTKREIIEIFDKIKQGMDTKEMLDYLDGKRPFLQSESIQNFVGPFQ
jgi:hypothetical protein